MWQDVLNEVMPHLVRLVTTIVVVLLTRWAIPAVEAYIGATKLDTIKRLAREAYAFVEAQAPQLLINGQQKLDMALAYLDARLAERHIPVTTEQMRAVIEEVWLEYNPQ
jgi:hypothetical protein